MSNISEEAILRPISLAGYNGQEHIKKSLKLYIKAAKMRGEPLDHTIIFGPSGLGKSTLASIIGFEMYSTVKTIAATSIKTVNDITNILKDLVADTILFIDEIHRLPIKVEEVLYFAMEDFKLDMKIGNSTDFSQVTMNLPKFTLIGATTKSGMLSEPLRNRFGISLELRPYGVTELGEIIMRSAELLGVNINKENAEIIGARSRGVPRIANGYLKRVRDFAMVDNEEIIDREIVLETFKALDIDEMGLNRQDRALLNTIIERFNFGPVGLTTLCSAIGDDEKTIEEAVEPYLIQIGMLEKTSRGRVATQKAYDFLKGI